MSTFDRAVYEKRLASAQEVLTGEGIDALLLGPSADLTYLTGIDAHSSERMNLFVLPRDGDPTMIVPGLEAPLINDASEQVAIKTWGDGDDPTSLAASSLGNVGKIAIGNRMWASFLLRLQTAVNAASWVEGDAVLRELRMIKDQTEIDALDTAARYTDKAWEQFIASGSITGLTELQALERLIQISRDAGLSNPSGIIGSGPNSASPHHGGNDRIIEDGDALVFDWGGKVDGYLSDVTRSAHVGEPVDEYRTVYALVDAANAAMFDTVKPGVALQELDRAARKVITDGGYGPNFLHRVGHGLGLEVHEEPYLVEGNTMKLRAGMAFSDEPGIYLEGKFGVRIEDTVVCTESGGRRLNLSSHELVIMS